MLKKVLFSTVLLVCGCRAAIALPSWVETASARHGLQGQEARDIAQINVPGSSGYGCYSFTAHVYILQTTPSGNQCDPSAGVIASGVLGFTNCCVKNGVNLFVRGDKFYDYIEQTYGANIAQSVNCAAVNNDGDPIAQALTAEYTQAVPGSGDPGYQLKDGNDPLITVNVTNEGTCSANEAKQCGQQVTCS